MIHSAMPKKQIYDYLNTYFLRLVICGMISLIKSKVHDTHISYEDGQSCDPLEISMF